MKRTVLYNWTNDDPPFVKRIDEARNRVISFCDELFADTPEHKAFNRVATGNQFTQEDVILMCRYAERVFKRIRNKWNDGSELSASIIQAGENFRNVMWEMKDYFFLAMFGQMT